MDLPDARFERMSDHHDQTEFLKHCLRYDTSAERDQMLRELVRLQHESRIFRLASYWIVGLIVPAVAALAFSDYLLGNLPGRVQAEVLNLLMAIVLGLTVCVCTISFLRYLLSKKLHGQRKKCRELVKKILAERLEPKPGAPPSEP
jgi:sulfite exporter TauE/SafE